jgi:hypothetical protein
VLPTLEVYETLNDTRASSQSSVYWKETQMVKLVIRYTTVQIIIYHSTVLPTGRRPPVLLVSSFKTLFKGMSRFGVLSAGLMLWRQR